MMILLLLQSITIHFVFQPVPKTKVESFGGRCCKNLIKTIAYRLLNKFKNIYTGIASKLHKLLFQSV